MEGGWIVMIDEGRDRIGCAHDQLVVFTFIPKLF